MLKMSLRKIRGSIQVYPENWINVIETNCYAYALGLDIKENDICKYAYRPGSISVNRKLFVYKDEKEEMLYLKYLSYDSFVDKLENDLDCLNLEYREVNPSEPIDSDEWKIAFLTRKDGCRIRDFHFLRQNSDGIWTQKKGYYCGIDSVDCMGKTVKNPAYGYWQSFEYGKCYVLKKSGKV